VLVRIEVAVEGTAAKFLVAQRTLIEVDGLSECLRLSARRAHRSAARSCGGNRAGLGASRRLCDGERPGWREFDLISRDETLVGDARALNAIEPVAAALSAVSAGRVKNDVALAGPAQ